MDLQSKTQVLHFEVVSRQQEVVVELESQMIAWRQLELPPPPFGRQSVLG